MALKKKTGTYDIHAYGEDTNLEGKPTISWQHIEGACGPTAEPDWTSDTTDNFATNIGLGMSELIYNKVHPLISPGIDSMDDDLPTWEDAGDGGVPKYLNDGSLNPDYPGGMTQEEFNEMEAGAISDQVNAKRFWLDLSHAIATGVIEHLKLDPNIPDNRDCGLETKQAAESLLEVRDQLVTVCTKLESTCSTLASTAEQIAEHASANGLAIPALKDYTSFIYDVVYLLVNPNPIDLANTMALATQIVTTFETAMGVHETAMLNIASSGNGLKADSESVKNSITAIKNALNAIDYHEADGTE